MPSIRALCLWICGSWNSESNTMWNSLKWCDTCTYMYNHSPQVYGRNDRIHCMVTYMLSTVCGIMNFEPFYDKCPRLYVTKSNAFSISLCICTLVWHFHRSNQEILWTCSPNSNIPDRVFWSLTFSTMSLRIPWRDRVIWSISPMTELYTTKNRH